jgi:hypothetical protein
MKFTSCADQLVKHKHETKESNKLDLTSASVGHDLECLSCIM